MFNWRGASGQDEEKMKTVGVFLKIVFSNNNLFDIRHCYKLSFTQRFLKHVTDSLLFDKTDKNAFHVIFCEQNVLFPFRVHCSKV